MFPSIELEPVGLLVSPRACPSITQLMFPLESAVGRRCIVFPLEQLVSHSLHSRCCLRGYHRLLMLPSIELEHTSCSHRLSLRVQQDWLQGEELMFPLEHRREEAIYDK